jgi:hypothetical protein
MLLYLVASSGPSKVPLYIDIFSLVERGVVTGLQLDMPTHLSKSATYFPCVTYFVYLYIKEVVQVPQIFERKFFLKVLKKSCCHLLCVACYNNIINIYKKEHTDASLVIIKQ